MEIGGYPPVERGMRESSYVELGSHNWSKNVNDDMKWFMGQDSSDIMMVDLDIRVTGHDDEIIQAGATFVDGFLMVHGSRLKHLAFSVCSKLQPYFKWSKSGSPCMYTIIKMENYVLRCCKRLCSLEISWMNLQRGEQVDNPIINHTITSLKLTNGWISGAESLQELLLRFPNLKYLGIRNCAFLEATHTTDTNSTVDDKKVNSPVNICVHDTSLDALSWDWYGGYDETWHDRYSKLQFKIRTTSKAHNSGQVKAHYYASDGLEVEEITAEQYEEELKAVAHTVCLLTSPVKILILSKSSSRSSLVGSNSTSIIEQSMLNIKIEYIAKNTHNILSS